MCVGYLTFAQTYKLSDFIETSPPLESSNQKQSLNWSKHEFKVENKNGELIVTEKKRNRLPISLSILNGKLNGTGHGEWGGKLSFISNDTTKKEIQIKEGNIQSIFSLKNKIYFVEGLAHMGINEGALFKLKKKNDSFQYKKIINFEDAPEALWFSNNVIFIAGYENFYKISTLDFKKQLLFKNTFWSSLYPNSIAVFDEKNIYVGIRSGYVKLDLIDKKLKFFKYKE